MLINGPAGTLPVIDGVDLPALPVDLIESGKVHKARPSRSLILR